MAQKQVEAEKEVVVEDSGPLVFQDQPARRGPSPDDLKALEARRNDFADLDALIKSAESPEVQFLAKFIKSYIVAP